MAFEHYRTLGVSTSSKQDEIKKAYKELMKKHHPDKNDNSPLANAMTQRITAAYAVLRDPDARGRYDKINDATRKREPGPTSGHTTESKYQFGTRPTFSSTGTTGFGFGTFGSSPFCSPPGFTGFFWSSHASSEQTQTKSNPFNWQNSKFDPNLSSSFDRFFQNGANSFTSSSYANMAPNPFGFSGWDFRFSPGQTSNVFSSCFGFGDAQSQWNQWRDQKVSEDQGRTQRHEWRNPNLKQFVNPNYTTPPQRHTTNNPPFSFSFAQTKPNDGTRDFNSNTGPKNTQLRHTGPHVDTIFAFLLQCGTFSGHETDSIVRVNSSQLLYNRCTNVCLVNCHVVKLIGCNCVSLSSCSNIMLLGCKNVRITKCSGVTGKDCGDMDLVDCEGEPNFINCSNVIRRSFFTHS